MPRSGARLNLLAFSLHLKNKTRSYLSRSVALRFFLYGFDFFYKILQTKISLDIGVFAVKVRLHIWEAVEPQMLVFVFFYVAPFLFAFFLIVNIGRGGGHPATFLPPSLARKKTRRSCVYPYGTRNAVT